MLTAQLDVPLPHKFISNLYKFQEGQHRTAWSCLRQVWNNSSHRVTGSEGAVSGHKQLARVTIQASAARTLQEPETQQKLSKAIWVILVKWDKAISLVVNIRSHQYGRKDRPCIQCPVDPRRKYTHKQSKRLVCASLVEDSQIRSQCTYRLRFRRSISERSPGSFQHLDKQCQMILYDVNRKELRLATSGANNYLNFEPPDISFHGRGNSTAFCVCVRMLSNIIERHALISLL